jgi:hypothetical protein
MLSPRARGIAFLGFTPLRMDAKWQVIVKLKTLKGD